jgi:hypothetical protein
MHTSPTADAADGFDPPRRVSDHPGVPNLRASREHRVYVKVTDLSQTSKKTVIRHVTVAFFASHVASAAFCLDRAMI